MDKIVLCIAGKNNIAVNIAQYVQLHFPDIRLIACCNSNDNGMNSFQRSFRKFCLLNNIEIFQLSDLYEINDLIFLSLEYDKIIKPGLFSSDKLFNIHFSYLPEYKGMYTSALPILHGKNYSGVSLHKIDSGIDTGDIISQRKFDLDQGLTSEFLYSLYINYGTNLIIENLRQLLEDKYDSFCQSIEKSTYYSKKAIDYSNLSIDLNKTADEISRQIRAFAFPAFQLPEVMGAKIYNTEFISQKSAGRAGTLIEDSEFYLIISTIDYNIKLLKDLRENLFESAINGDISRLKYYLNNRYDIHQRSRQGWDLAILAAYNGQINFLKYLIENLNWDLNTINYNGTTLTMYLMTYCSENNQPDILSAYLNKYNPDISQRDFHGKDILHYAEKYNNEAVLEIIKNNFK